MSFSVSNSFWLFGHFNLLFEIKIFAALSEGDDCFDGRLVVCWNTNEMLMNRRCVVLAKKFFEKYGGYTCNWIFVVLQEIQVFVPHYSM